MLPYCGPLVLPRCTTPLLGRSPRANRCENWWLRTCAHLQKNSSKICDFHFFLRFTYRHYFKSNLINSKNTYIFCSLFSAVSCFFSRCASLLWSLLSYPVVHPTAAPQGLQRRPGTARFHFPPTCARWRKLLTPTRCIGITARGRHHGETQRRNKTGKHNEKMKTKKNGKVISINVKSI